MLLLLAVSICKKYEHKLIVVNIGRLWWLKVNREFQCYSFTGNVVCITTGAIIIFLD